METIESNKLIAEFMEVQVRESADGGLSYRPDKYWECLMPVVEKIESLKFGNNCSTRFQFEIRGKLCLVHDKFKIERKDFLSLYYKNYETKIEAVYNAVVEFIKLYNENKED